MKKVLIFSIIALVASACSLEYYPSDEMTSAQMKEEPASAVYSTDGNYSMFKDPIPYKTEWPEDGQTYVRHYFQMTEFRGDNATLAGASTDHFTQSFCYNDTSNLRTVTNFWWCAYRIIYGANAMIESLQEGVDAATDHIKGENYFMRAIAHLHLVTMYAQPYSLNPDGMGVVLRTDTGCATTERASLKVVYKQIEDDLKEAIRLMSGSTKRGDNGFVSKETAQGLLSRVYLYTGQNELCHKLVTEMLGSALPETKLESGDTYMEIFSNARKSKEVLWCIAHEITENRQKSSIASMYYTADGIGSDGWGEIYISDPLIRTFSRHPEDKRFLGMAEKFSEKPDEMMAYWPVENPGDNFRTNHIDISPVDNGDGTWNCKDENGASVKVLSKTEGGIKKYYFQRGSETVDVMISTRYTDRMTYPAMLMKKFSYQDGISQLSSPIMIRWAEVILNRAEAYCKEGNDDGAIADLNVIRKRAGIPEYKDAAEAMAKTGHSTLLDVIIEERNLELCFEGHRAIDVFRNGKDLDRRYAGAHPWEVVKAGDTRFPFRIPFDEITASGILQNP